MVRRGLGSGESEGKGRLPLLLFDLEHDVVVREGKELRLDRKKCKEQGIEG